MTCVVGESIRRQTNDRVVSAIGDDLSRLIKLEDLQFFGGGDECVVPAKSRELCLI